VNGQSLPLVRVDTNQGQESIENQKDKTS